MSKFCKNCGAQLDLDAKFCGVCGTTVVLTEPIPEQTGQPAKSYLPRQPSETKTKTVVAQGMHSIAQLSGSVIAAPTKAGEIIFDAKVPQIAGELIQVINPLKVLFSGAWNVIRGIGAAFKDKKKWIPVLILAAVWFILTLLPNLGFNPRWIQGLSWLTFAQGGFGMMGYPNWLQMAGGIIGKGVVAGLVFSLFSGGNPLRKIGSGLKIMFSSYSLKNLADAGLLMCGIGISLICYNFMAGFAAPSMTMAGISAALLTLRALGSSTGFLRKFFGGFTAKKTAKGKTIDSLAVNRIIGGIATGFILSVPLSALHILNLPYILGGVLLIAGIALGIAQKSKKETATV